MIVDIFRNRPQGAYPPATEVLFRFDANAVRRIRGVVHSVSGYAGRAATIAALDERAGGSWWRDGDDRSLNNEQYVDWFMAELLNRICKKADCSGWNVEVYQRPNLQPAYYLFFLTRHRGAMEIFGETISRATEKWRRTVFDEAVSDLTSGGQGLLMEPDEIFKHDEAQLASQWQEQLERNIIGLLRQHKSFIVRNHFDEVFSGVLGVARTKHLRSALKKLNFNGIVKSDSTGDLFGKRVVRGVLPTET